MDGYNLIIISGIDGSFEEFNKVVAPWLNASISMFLRYDRGISFKKNISAFERCIKELRGIYCVVGWSIGAVAAAYLSSLSNIKSVILINAFYVRSEILSRRAIECDEEVRIDNIVKDSVTHFFIIVGKKDDKIPYYESLKIQKYLSVSLKNFFLFNEASHNLNTFPLKEISNIINGVCNGKYAYNCKKKQ